MDELCPSLLRLKSRLLSWFAEEFYDNYSFDKELKKKLMNSFEELTRISLTIKVGYKHPEEENQLSTSIVFPANSKLVLQCNQYNNMQ